MENFLVQQRFCSEKKNFILIGLKKLFMSHVRLFCDSPVFATIQVDSHSPLDPKIKQLAYLISVQIRYVRKFLSFSCEQNRLMTLTSCSKLDITSHQIKLQVSRPAVCCEL